MAALNALIAELQVKYGFTSHPTQNRLFWGHYLAINVSSATVCLL